MKNIPHYFRGIPCLLVIIVFFGYLASSMGLANMLNTIMRTAHDLLLNTVFYLMGICVITGALGKIFVEFGVAIVTPFQTDGTPDYEALGKLVNEQIEGGADFLCVLGTTASTSRLA